MITLIEITAKIFETIKATWAILRKQGQVRARLNPAYFDLRDCLDRYDLKA